MSTKRRGEAYKQLRQPPPPPPKTKQQLHKTVSAPQVPLGRLLARRQNGEEGARQEKSAGSSERDIDLGTDLLTDEPRSASPRDAPTGTTSASTVVVPEGNLIDLDTDDAASSPPPVRSMSASGRPPHRRPPPPPPPASDRARCATVSGGKLRQTGPGKIPPAPPPKPAYISSVMGMKDVDALEEEERAEQGETKRDDRESEDREKPEPRPRVPSPYLLYKPKNGRFVENPSQDTRTANPVSPSLTPTISTSSTPSPTSPSPTTRQPKAPVPHPRPITYPNPPPREMEYTEREHPRNVFDYLDKMRHKGDLCDVTLVANSREIRVHKVVLAACSQYFESMFIGEFAEPDGEPIIMEEVDDEALQALVDFAYTSRIRLTDRNIYLIFAAADLLQFPGVRGACFKFFKQQMNKSNCIRTWLFAESHNCTELLDAAVKYIECNFLDVVRGREFLSLEQADVVAKVLALEDIAITSEEQVYEAALNWLQQDPQGRGETAAKVFQSVRFPNISRDYLLHCSDNEPLIKENPECLQLLIEALKSHTTGIQTRLRKKLLKQGSAASYSNVQPRPASMAVETVEFCRDNQTLGMRIMGGADRPHHVFRQGDKPGIFILMITPDGAAAKTGKLRPGDRILKVNGVDMSSLTHEQTIRMLKISPDPLSVLIRHEPPPQGLQELTLVTKPGEGFGISINGGVNGYPGNPLDETDEGIFISQVIPGGAAERDSRLKEGMRILQVNSVSMLGKTYSEALHVLQGVLDRINLLVCHGYDPYALQSTVDTVDEFGYVGSETMYNRMSGEGGGGGGEGGGGGGWSCLEPTPYSQNGSSGTILR